MKESPISEEQKKLRHQIGVYTEAVFMHSIALGSGKTHQNAADRIMELVELYSQKRYQEGELKGRIDEVKNLGGQTAHRADTGGWCRKAGEQFKECLQCLIEIVKIRKELQKHNDRERNSLW